MDWFERIAGFREQDYASTQSRFEVVGALLRSKANQKAFEIGNLSLPSLGQLREQVHGDLSCRGRLRVSLVSGNVRDLHQVKELEGALFQVASQFNMLEMTSPNVTPEDGVTRYQHDPTQGPACAVAAGAATIYRSYFAPVSGHIGQTADHQLDALADVGAHLSESLGMTVNKLWEMRNGYALCTATGLKAIAHYLGKSTASDVDAVRSKLRIGIHRDVQVTDLEKSPPRLVSQAFCSALPVAYSKIPKSQWGAFAQVVLEAAYEATLWAGVLNARRGISNVVMLTRLGGGAFGNDDRWIHAAMLRALELASGCDLDVRIVRRSAPTPALTEIAARFH
jgi:hypothetical protein